ncbi:MAG: HAMP domain-containing histidine kinase [Acidimicrobiia bacterium]|nr:MAG: HAMP domain-containing histidine kinase [Acidimicrobiia bacterium]
MAPRSLRTRMALTWGIAFFVMGMVTVLSIGLITLSYVLDDPTEAADRLVEELGFEADSIEELTLSDRAGNEIEASRTLPVIQSVVDRTRADIARIIRILIPSWAVIAGVGGWWLAGREVRRITSITNLARQVSAERLDARIEFEGPEDELKDLAHEFDVMMERLEHAFAAQRQFASSASHELRTPLTVIRTELDVALDTPNPTPAELAEMAEGIREAIDRSERVIDGLLVLARTGIIERSESVDLVPIVTEALEQAPTDDLIVTVDTPQALVVHGDRSLLDRLARNLVTNAAIHNHDGGAFTLKLTSDGSVASLTVANSGDLLDAATVGRLGEPFFRAGDRTVPGTGLGVAVVRSIAEAHGGSLSLSPRAGGGLVATVVLPSR